MRVADASGVTVVYRLRDNLAIRCVNREVARNICLQLNIAGIPRDAEGYRLYDRVTWVVRL